MAEKKSTSRAEKVVADAKKNASPASRNTKKASEKKPPKTPVSAALRPYFPYFSRLPEPQTMKLYVFSLVFALMGNLQGKVFSYCPTTLSKSLAEVRFASLVAWA